MAGFFVFVMTLVLGTLVLIAGIRWLRLDGRELESGVSPAEVERLRSAMESMEARLDELQEQQRFLERLLEERPEQGRLAPGGAAEESAEESAAGRSILLDDEIRAREDRS